MTDDFVCVKCWRVMFSGRENCVCGGTTKWVKWSPACEKLAKTVWNITPHRKGYTQEFTRRWVLENVLKEGWKHD